MKGEEEGRAWSGLTWRRGQATRGVKEGPIDSAATAEGTWKDSTDPRKEWLLAWADAATAGQTRGGEEDEAALELSPDELPEVGDEGRWE